MKPFKLDIPTKVFFGRGVFDKAMEELENLIHGNIVLVTTGRSLVLHGYLEKVVNILRKNIYVKEIIIIDDISTNPKLTEIQRGIEKGNAHGGNIVLGIGGGSSIDAAKAIAAGIGMRITAWQLYREDNIDSKQVLPIVAVPTTAGTGSELSKGAIITDTGQMIKKGIRGPSLYPMAAIVDPAFTDTMPLKVTVETGFDVLAHAIESYVSLAANPFTRTLSEMAVKTAGKYLPMLVQDLSDYEARNHMSFASMSMGINLSNSSTCLPHRMQYPIGARTDTSHGLGLAILYPAWIKHEYVYSADALNKVAGLLVGEEITGARAVQEVMNNYINKLGLNKKLSDLGINYEDIEELSDGVSCGVVNDQVMHEDNVVMKIYKESI